MTDDADELATYRRRLAAVEAKLAKAETAIDRFYYGACAAGWRRSIAVLEQDIATRNDQGTRER